VLRTFGFYVCALSRQQPKRNKNNVGVAPGEIVCPFFD
jgi:hypothetical protein